MDKGMDQPVQWKGMKKEETIKRKWNGRKIKGEWSELNGTEGSRQLNGMKGGDQAMKKKTFTGGRTNLEWKMKPKQVK